ncbi:ribokinase [Neobacillus piezotolerans]|uniref:Ribokinase n=1 Tax=Neobacillus piezotolerans TaxID=2259171 RepID=A0A3D8GUV6_9BACI|nr:ribokinase [Neobacillus piezotolerans]RDU38250.1 ribokinase [Neobacillus piezotolerans]
MKKIAVVGSLNIDYFVETDIFPSTGETIMGKGFFMSVGGKGANQAVAAARLGGKVSMFGSVGNDDNGKLLIGKMEKEGVNVSHLNKVEGSNTGVAFIEICNSENRILVISGANQHTNIQYINRIQDRLLEHDIILFQLETPLSMIEYIIPILAKEGKTIILNPAPACQLSSELIANVTFLTPNEHEYPLVLNEKGELKETLEKHPNKVIVTCGSRGVYFHEGKGLIKVPAIQVEAVDTTGAGDTFSGAFTLALSEGRTIEESIRFGTIAAGLSVRKKGAQTGMPTRKEMEHFIKEELV